MSRIDANILNEITRRVDRNRNNSIESTEGRVLGSVGNRNGVNGTRETSDAMAQGQAALYGFQLDQLDADAIAGMLSGGDAWVSKEDVFISDQARARIDGSAGGAIDGRVSKSELSSALTRGGLAVSADGIMLSSEAQSRFSGRPTPPSSDRPTPPSTGRPTPPSTGRPTPPAADRPTPPSVDPGRPVPPAVHNPRYYWQPEFPIILPSDKRPLPKIALPPAPAPARKVELGEVSNDVVQLLTGYERLRTKKKSLGFITNFSELNYNDAKAALAKGETIYLAPDGGAHLNKDVYKPVSKLADLQPLLPGLRTQKQGELQAAENQAYQGRVRQWNESDIQRRQSNLPSFNSIYDTNTLSLNNFIVSQGGRSFNRNLITAMNIYNQNSTKREIAERWHQNPDMSTPEFNRMANSVLTQKIANLGWQASYMGDPESYLGSIPVPGLRYPDTQEDIDYNVETIRRVASELPILLNSAVND